MSPIFKKKFILVENLEMLFDLNKTLILSGTANFCFRKLHRHEVRLHLMAQKTSMGSSSMQDF